MILFYILTFLFQRSELRTNHAARLIGNNFIVETAVNRIEEF